MQAAVQSAVHASGSGSAAELRCVLPVSPHWAWVVPTGIRSEVLWQPQVQRLPGAPPAWLGVVNVRGRVRPVLDPAQVWKVPVPPEVDPHAHPGVLVLLDEGEHAFALRLWQEPRIESLRPWPQGAALPPELSPRLAIPCGQLGAWLCCEIDHRAWLAELVHAASSPLN